MLIRPARDEDAEAATRLLRRSIRELCTPDHHCDPAAVRSWLANKRPEIFREWLARPANILLVVEGEKGALLGVGGANRGGEITMNYVGPNARFQGVSSGVVAELERRPGMLGLRECRLTSTQTAHRFYLARGYRDSGPPARAFGGMPALPMTKQLPVL